jgi:fluoride exporter
LCGDGSKLFDEGDHCLDAISALAIFIGAGFGALLRWGLGLALNPIFPTVPLGTLMANVLGGLLMGLAMGLLTQFESLSPTTRLAITTGFLGGLTTFSTFSAETVTLIMRAEYLWATVLVLAHVVLSLLATLGGIAAVAWLYNASSGASP